MKLLFLILALFSLQSFASLRTCHDVDKSGHEFILTINPETKQGEVVVIKDGGLERNLNLKIYIINHKSPGFHFYEGLATNSIATREAELFRLKVANHNETTKLVLTSVDGSNPRTTNLRCRP